MLVVACSSVPDVEFVEGDAAVSDSGATSSGTVKPDGSAPAGDAAVDQASPSTYCANNGKSNPPPGGICCGAVACVGCSSSDCSNCDAKCGVRGPACCKTGGSVRCAAVDQCK